MKRMLLGQELDYQTDLNVAEYSNFLENSIDR